MKPKVIVIGAGITGAAIAFRLAKNGADVTVIKAEAIASGASGRSFGWLNASYYASHDHFKLRLAGMEAWRRLSEVVGPDCVDWSGCLWWESTGPALDAAASELASFDYSVRRLDRKSLLDLEPNLSDPPEECLHFQQEGAVDLAVATARLLASASAYGAALWLGVPVSGFLEQNGAVRGVTTAHGNLEADLVVVAAGTMTGLLLKGVGVSLPMLKRPGVLLQTRPTAPVIRHILASPGQELRQMPDGRILAPAAASHQGDSAQALAERPDQLAKQALSRLSGLLSGARLEIERVIVGWRPVCEDGLPAIGPLDVRGLYVATMHSGATLGPLIGELAASEILSGVKSPLLAPFRPQRFS